jgi:hypothetical protein
MAQTRAVMPQKFLPLADELLETTGVPDYSSLISVLLSRYGKHLLNTWEIANCPGPIAPATASPEPTAPETFTPMEF